MTGYDCPMTTSSPSEDTVVVRVTKSKNWLVKNKAHTRILGRLNIARETVINDL